MSEQSNEELLGELGIEVTAVKKRTFTRKEERIIAGFEEIQDFFKDNKRIPTHGEDNDIFERIYAVRLDQIRANNECKDLVQELDHQGLLEGAENTLISLDDDMSDEDLLAELGIKTPQDGDITFLKHVKTRAKIKVAEEIANHTRCEDFDRFKPLFESVRSEIKSGLRDSIPYKDFAKVKKGDFFILSGQIVYVAKVEEEFVNENRQKDGRLRLIYDNGTESDILMRSLQRALNKDEAARRITNASLGPLFDGISEEGDIESGTIYVLRSKSNHPLIVENREVIHKIGVTGSKVEARLSNAKLDPTFLMAEVEIVATYELFNINRVKLEKILHRFFKSAQLKIEIMDRFNNPVVPQEWFLVPVNVINDVVERIKDGSISRYVYDIETARIKLNSD